MQFETELRVGDAAVFRGESPVQLRAGRTTTVVVDLSPVVAGIVGAQGLPTMTAYGDTLEVSAVTVFTTGDTVDVAPATWSGLDPAIATVSVAGTVVSRADGEARLVAQFGQFSDTVRVRVLAEVASIVVSPVNQSIPIGQTRQFTAMLFDPRANPITGRPVTWSSTNPAVLQVNANGIATAVGIGPATITATASTAQGSAAAAGAPGQPLTSGFTATVIGPGRVRLDAQVLPNGSPTDTWFEWTSPGVNTGSALTLRNPVGAGLLRVPVETTLQGLQHATQYTARVVATSLLGSHESEIAFMTPAVPPTALTLGVTDPTVPQGVINGQVNANGSPTTVWFEWGPDSTMISDTTGAQVVTGTTLKPVSAAIPIGMPGILLYYRIVASNTGGTVHGELRSFTVLPPDPMGPPTAATLPGVVNGPAIVTLNGVVQPNGHATVAQFEWSLNPAFSPWMTTAAQSIGSGNAPIPVAASLFNLAPNTTVFFRATATNVDGQSKGLILSVTTPGTGTPPSVTTSAATSVGEAMATLNGVANANGSPTTVWFEYGTDPALSTFTATAAQPIGSGNAAVPFSAKLSGLILTTTHYYRAVASSAGGTVLGTIVSFEK